MRLFDRWFRRSEYPIGIDFGNRSIKLAQAAIGDDGEPRLAKARVIDVPADRGQRLVRRLDLFREEVAKLLNRSAFAGRDAVIALPASWLTVHRLRVPMSLKDDAIGEAVRSELTDHLPPGHQELLTKHVVAGEVYHGQELRREVIGVSAPRAAVDALLAAAADSGLNVVAMPTEVQALANWQAAELRAGRADRNGAMPGGERSAQRDSNRAQLIIDLGHRNARVYVVQGAQVLFARAIKSSVWNNTAVAADEQRSGEQRSGEQRSGEQRSAGDASQDMAHRTPLRTMATGGVIEPAVDAAAGIALLHAPTAERLRRRLAGASPARSPIAGSPGKSPPERAQIPVSAARLIEEVRQSCRYFESTFPQVLLDRALFVGGGAAAHPQLWRQIAQAIDLPAQVANPVARLGTSGTLTAMLAGTGGASGPAFSLAAALALGDFTSGSGQAGAG